MSEVRQLSQPAIRPQPMRRIELRDLLEGQREAVIVHDGQEYRLRITSNDKLILTK